jgi:transketolase
MNTTTVASPPSRASTVPDHVLRLLSRVTGDEKHDPSAHSTLHVLWVLYSAVLRVSPATVDDPDRDRFLLSKGHGPASYYAVLAARGFLPEDQLTGLATASSALGHHPDRKLLAGVEISSGSLGHGLPLAVGTALGLRAQGRTEPRVIALVGDAELDEGSNAEAIAVAARLGLDRLTCVVVDNDSASHGWPGGIAARFAVEGWASAEVDDRDHVALRQALTATATDRPTVVVVRSAPKWATTGGAR